MKYLCTRPFYAVCLALGLMSGLCAAEAWAQQPSRSGFWIESGVGTGGVWVGCSDCEEPEAAFDESAYLRVGGAFSERVLWGLEGFALLNQTLDAAESDSTLEVQNGIIGPVVLWYPWQGGVFVKGGVGLSYGEVRLRGPDENTVMLGRGVGSGMTFGAGFDVPVLSWLALTVSFDAYFGAIGDIAVRDAYVDDVITTMYNANFALTIR